MLPRFSWWFRRNLNARGVGFPSLTVTEFCCMPRKWKRKRILVKSGGGALNVGVSVASLLHNSRRINRFPRYPRTTPSTRMRFYPSIYLAVSTAR